MKRILFGIFILLIWNVALHAQTTFYQGKTITLIAGVTAGSLYDVYARLIAQHWTRHIPGKPDIIVQNMTGAVSKITANHVYSVAKPDGLTLGSSLLALYFDQLVGRKEVQFDYAKYVWMGSPVQNEHRMCMRTDAPYKIRRLKTSVRLRCLPSVKPPAPVQQGILYSQTHGRGSWNQIQSRHRLPGRPRD